MATLPRLRSRAGVHTLLAATLAFLVGVPAARAQFLWGAAGAGGDGVWNVNPSNLAWSSGGTPVAWPVSGTAATFGGTGGTVTVVAVAASSLTFTTSGYVLAPAADSQAVLTANSATRTFDAQAPASLTLTSIVGTGSTTLVKQGAAKLSVNTAAIVTTPTVQVAVGELAFAGSTVLGGGIRALLADAADAVLSFDMTTLVAVLDRLEGGGPTGGIVRPGGTNALTLTLAGSTDATFAGSLQDNSSTPLLLAKTGPATQTLAGANTHSGATVVSGGTLALAGGGSLVHSAVTIGSGATLVLDNTGTLLANRLGDSRPVALTGGTLRFLGHGAASTAETTGLLSLGAGQSRIESTRSSGPSATLTFSAFTRLGAGAVVEFTGDGAVKFTGAANANGILGGFAVAGDHWAALDGTQAVVAFSGYTAALTSGAATDNVRLTAAHTATAAVTRNSLALDTAAGDFALNLGASANTLKLTSGGLLATGPGTATISGGALASNNSFRDLIAFVRGALALASPIVDVTNTVGPVTTTSPVSLTKAGEGTLTLSGASTYTGETRVLAGTLALAGGSAIPDTSAGSLSTGATRRLGGGTETTGGLSGTGTVQLENGHLTIAGSGLGGSPTIALGSGSLTINSSATTEFGGAISGTGGVTKSGAGSLTFTAPQTFTGTLHVNAGSLLLLNEGLADAMPLTLAGGTFGFSPDLTGPGTETLGPLTLAGTAYLQFHPSTTLPTATTLAFGDSSTLAWSGQLIVTNYTTSLDSLRFGTGASALTASQLSLIKFDVNGALADAQISSLGFVTPSAIPEPATVALLAGAAALALAAWRRRSRERAVSARGSNVSEIS